MTKKIKLTSSRKFLLLSTLSVTSLVLMVILTCLIFVINAKGKSLLEENTRAWARSIAQLSLDYLADDQKDAQRKLKNKLEKIVTPYFINYIHIYEENNNKTVYFAGFNKNIYFPAITPKINQIAELSSIKHKPNYLEYIVKIEREQQLYGYVYIQSSKKYISDFIQKLSIIAIGLLLFSLTVTTFLALFIQKRLNQPITTMVESIQEISQSKNYNKRIAKLSIIEMDVLARNINILLNRTEKHINKQDQNHHHALLQNNTLSAKVHARTDALKESNQELLSTLEKLHQFQDQLVETEKMASLGDMVAGIAHEVNTPIGLGVTASTLLSDRLHEIKTAFEEKTLKSSQLKKFLTQGEENIALIYRNLERAAKLISSFKKVAVDQSSADARQFNMKELLEEVFLTLRAKLDSAQVKLVVDCPDNLIIESKPGPINQILINLILNSILHGFEDKPNGSISISIFYLSNQIHLNYKDDGIGIDESIKEKVFEPFTTTKRGSGGSGLGLHLVYNLVTQALNGHIDFESSVGNGTTFDITFPVFLVSEQ